MTKSLGTLESDSTVYGPREHGRDMFDFSDTDSYRGMVEWALENKANGGRLHTHMRLNGFTGPQSDILVGALSRVGALGPKGSFVDGAEEVNVNDLMDRISGDTAMQDRLLDHMSRLPLTEGRRRELRLLSRASALGAEGDFYENEAAAVADLAARMGVPENEAEELLRRSTAAGWLVAGEDGSFRPSLDHGVNLPDTTMARFNSLYSLGRDVGAEGVQPVRDGAQTQAPDLSRATAAAADAEAQADADGADAGARTEGSSDRRRRRDAAPRHVFVNQAAQGRGDGAERINTGRTSERTHYKGRKLSEADKEVLRNFQAMVPGESSFAVELDRAVDTEDREQVLEQAKANVSQITDDYRQRMKMENPFLGDNAKLSPRERVGKVDALHKHMSMLMVGNLMAPLEAENSVGAVARVGTTAAVLWALSPQFRTFVGEHTEKLEAFVGKHLEGITGKKESEAFFKSPKERSEAAARAKKFKKNSQRRLKLIKSGKRLPMSVDSAAQTLVNLGENAYDAMRISGDVAQVTTAYNDTVTQLRRQFAADGLEEKQVFGRARDIVAERGATDSGFLAKFQETHLGMLTPSKQTVGKDGVARWNGRWQFSDGQLLAEDSACFSPRPPKAKPADEYIALLGSTYATEMRLAADRGDFKAMTDITVGYNAAPGLYGHGLSEAEAAVPGTQGDTRLAAQQRCAIALQMMLDDGLDARSCAGIHAAAMEGAVKVLDGEIPEKMNQWKTGEGKDWSGKARAFEAERKKLLRLTEVPVPAGQHQERVMVQVDPDTGKIVEDPTAAEKLGAAAQQRDAAAQANATEASKEMLPKSNDGAAPDRGRDGGDGRTMLPVADAGPRGDRGRRSARATSEELSRRTERRAGDNAPETPAPVGFPAGDDRAQNPRRPRRVVRRSSEQLRARALGFAEGESVAASAPTGSPADAGGDKQESLRNKVNERSGDRERGTEDWRRLTGEKVAAEVPQRPKLPSADVQTRAQRQQAEAHNSSYDVAGEDGSRQIDTSYEVRDIAGMRKRGVNTRSRGAGHAARYRRVQRNQEFNREDDMPVSEPGPEL